MSDQQSASTGSGATRRVNVAFSFAAGCEIVLPDQQSGFPPGGGLGDLEIVLDPLDLDGLGPEAASAAMAKRASDLAFVTQALALSALQSAQAFERRSAKS